MENEVTQGDFYNLMSYNPSSNKACGTSCPVDMVTWHEAAAFCNALSSKKGTIECYQCAGKQQSVICSPKSLYVGGNIYQCPGYRLPTEAEWEYAYRSGVSSAFYNGGIYSCSGTDNNADQIGWYSGNSNSTLHAVGLKKANGWGIHDMAGNVWEWTNDWFVTDLGSAVAKDPWGSTSGYSRVMRGGYWNSPPQVLRAAFRSFNNPTKAKAGFGFRCVRTQ
jgi:formylglycine-generating enzyme required for sulfatase activity